jgi:8-oxo-dGTP pyrophosphatase MutT (NUDIX family)
VIHVNKRAAGLTICFEKEILLGKRCETWHGKPIPLGGYWSIFGGAIEEGENPMIAAIRELYEETQIKVDLHQLNYSKDLHSEFENSITEFSVYFATLWYKPEVILNAEHTEYIWYPIGKIEEFPYNIQKDLVDCILMYRDNRYQP